MFEAYSKSKTATCGPVVVGLYREVAVCNTEVDCNVLCSAIVGQGGRAGCFREMAALYSGHLRQVSFYWNRQNTE